MKILALAHKLERSYAKTGTFNRSKRKKQCEVLCRRSRRHWQLVREMKKKMNVLSLLFTLFQI